METITRINGNGQPYTTDLPKIIILGEKINDVALNHILENTGLTFVFTGWGYEAQPRTSQQIVALILTYNYKTRYYNNSDHQNTLFLKHDHHVGFDVDSICLNCCEHNNIRTNGMDLNSRLAC